MSKENCLYEINFYNCLLNIFCTKYFHLFNIMSRVWRVFFLYYLLIFFFIRFYLDNQFSIQFSIEFLII